MKRPEHLQNQYYDQVAAVDAETYFAKDFSLRMKSLTMTDYIRHERFELQTLAVQLDSWKVPQVAVGLVEAQELMDDIDWSRTAMLAHHNQFDGLIVTHWLDIEPVFWLDTMSISRVLYGPDVNHSFDALSKRLGMKGKVNVQGLKDVQGLYLDEMTPAQIKKLKLYNSDDAGDTLKIFKKIGGHVSLDELRAMDMTLRMYNEPLLELNGELLQELHGREVKRRDKAVADAGTDVKTLGSSQRFADLLRSRGVVPPMKLSPRTGQPAYAFAKTDLEFKALLDHEDEDVRKAVEARLANKGNIVENRSKRLLARVGLPTPVYLSYAAARTLRWGGGDKVNWQNFSNRGDGKNLRRAVCAPKGTKLVIADAKQIEARMLAWRSGFQEKLDAFRDFDRGTGRDIYCVAGSGIYGFEVIAEIHKQERFVGKVYELAGGYGAGATRMQRTFKLGQYGPPLDLPLHEIKSSLERWRITNAPITGGSGHNKNGHWQQIERAAVRAWVRGELVEDGPITFERFKSDGYMHLPNGTYIKYPNVGWCDEKREMFYVSRNGYVKLWGGIITENECQALSCALLKWQLLRITEELPFFRVCLLVHDETVGLALDKDAREYADTVQRLMSTGPAWAEGLPLSAGVDINDIYERD